MRTPKLKQGIPVDRWNKAVEVYRQARVAQKSGDINSMAELLNYLGTILVEVHPQGGRPRLDFDKERFEELCGYQCTLIEISLAMGMSEDVIERRCMETYNKGFADVYRLKRGRGHTSLRRAQFKAAMEGNPTMLIWLGKQQLNQQDSMKVIITPNQADKLIDDAVEAHKLPKPETFGGEPVVQSEM